MKSISKSFRGIFIFVLLAFFFFAFTLSTAAMTTRGMNIDVKVNKDYSFDYEESITVNFDYPQHGIYRNIPYDTNYKITDVSVGAGYEYETLKESGNLVIKIGSADILLEGETNYTIKYKLRGIKENDPENDYMYIDVLPQGWETPIDHLTAVVHLPEDMTFEDINYHSNLYGQTGAEYGTWTFDEKAHTITFKGDNLDRGIAATIKADIPDGYWQGALDYSWTKKWALAIIAFGLAFITWLRATAGRNPELIKPVEFYPPDGMPPIEVGYMLDGNVDQPDITSTFFYLAEKGYLRIEEYKENKFRFMRLAVPEGEPKSVQRFYRAIFGKRAFDPVDPAVESEKPVKSDSIGSRLGKAYDAIPELVKNDFKGEKKLFTDESKKADSATKFIFFAVMTLVPILAKISHNLWQVDGLFIFVSPLIASLIFVLMLSKLSRVYYYRMSRRGIKTTWRVVLWLIIYFFVASLYLASYVFGEKFSMIGDISSILMVIFIIIVPLLLLGMKTRGRWSNDIYGRVLGFRDFIKDAELDKLNELVEQDPEYFYNILPYAYVFGLTKRWAGKFEGMNLPEPDWYQPYGGFDSDRVFTPMIMNSMFNDVSDSFVKSMNTLDTGSSGSFGGGGGFGSGGGFGGGGSFGGGGGFSGGGFGGGGGGSW